MKKTFDCVEMQHRGGEAVRQAVKGMSVEEEVLFWKRRTQEMLTRHDAGNKKRAARVRKTPVR